MTVGVEDWLEEVEGEEVEKVGGEEGWRCQCTPIYYKPHIYEVK